MADDQIISLEEFAALFRQWEEEYDRKKLRKERPWTGDIIRVLWGAKWMFMDQLTRQLWNLRNPSGLPMPTEFEKTVQSTLNHHTFQSEVWRKNGAKADDDLFYSPKGKRSGTWAVNRERAVTWLRARKLPEA
jgi:hypothetical protein